ncbi:MAG: class C sortase [Clostridiales bacterium]|nr:class C sortase [Clostridiales bacterium]
MRKRINLIAIVLLIVGIGFLAYPNVLKVIFDRQATQAVDQFEQLRADESRTEHTISNCDSILYAELRKAMFDYNEKLYVTGQSGLIDQLSYEEPDFHLSDYGIDSKILGYISIPSIDVKLPIYNGASEKNMAKGAAYLANTSLPVGGNNTNCVIAAHTRYNGIYLFKKITELKPGDEIYITNLWETLVYKVSETKVIDPMDSQNIYIKEGRSLVTLSTCHPFPKNDQRYLVYAESVGSN